MKIRANRKPLADALAWVSQALAKGHAVPSLSGIHLSTSEGTLTMRAFDHHVGHTAQLPVDVIDDGEALVSGRFLATVISGLRGGEVELVLDGRDLTIRSGRSTYRTRLMLVGDYPKLPGFPTRVGIIDADTLGALTKAVAAPVDDGSPRETTAGVHIEAGDGEPLWVVGSDDQARSVHVARGQWSQDAAIDATVPSLALAAAVKGMEGGVELGVTDGIFALRDNARTVTMRTYNSKFLSGKWRAVLAAASENTKASILADRDGLADAIKRVAALGDDGRESYVGLVVTPDAITITGGAEIGDGEDVIDAEGPPDTTAWLGLNASLMVQALAAVGPGQVSLGLGAVGEISPTKVVHVIPAGRDDQSTQSIETELLVMPRRWIGGIPA